MSTLTQLEDDSIAALVYSIATPDALRAFLAASAQVQAVRDALRSHLIDGPEIIKRVRLWLTEFRSGFKLRHEPALCALVVAIESHPTTDVEEMLDELAFLSVRELGVASRIARVCLKHRRATVSANKTAILRLEQPSPRPHATEGATPVRVSIPTVVTHERLQVA